MTKEIEIGDTTVVPAGIEEHDETESVKLFGPPGSGKTTNAAARVAILLRDHDYTIGDVCWLTYRKSLAMDTLRRLVDAGVVEEKQLANPTKGATRYIGTTHAVASRSVSGAGEPIKTGDKFAFCKQRNINIEESISGEMTVGEKLFRIFTYARKNLLDPTDETHLRHIDEWHDLKDDWRGSVPETYRAWRSYLDDQNKIMFWEQLAAPLRENVTPGKKILVVDEYHDAYPLMAKLAEYWADAAEIVMVPGDPHQCIPEGETVMTPSGKRPIEDIDLGDEVVSAYTNRETHTAEVEAISKREAHGPIYQFITESGHRLRCTADHKLFARLPPSTYGDDNYHYVYAMRSAEGDVRIGKSKCPENRFNLEGSATRMMVLGVYESDKEARLHEKKWSYEYGIPMDVFKSREDADGVGLPQEYINQLYNAIDSQEGFNKLCEDLGADPDGWHRIAQGVTSAEGSGWGRNGGGKRAPVNLRMCRVRQRAGYSDTVTTHIEIETSDNAVQKVVREFDELNESASKVGKRYRKQSTDYAAMRQLAHRVASRLREVGIMSIVNETASYGSIDDTGRMMNLPVVPAANVHEGMYVPVDDGDGGVRYERITTREVESGRGEIVYDLTTPPTHNFCVGGVFVHNCINSFDGADPDFYHKLPYPEVELPTAWERPPYEHWYVATNVLANAHDPPDMDIQNRGTFHVVDSPTFRFEADKWRVPDINEPNTPAWFVNQHGKNTMLLARTTLQLDGLARSLEQAGILFETPTSSPVPGWQAPSNDTFSDRVALYNALQKVKRLSPNAFDSGKSGLDTYGGGEDTADPKRIVLAPKEAAILVDHAQSKHLEPKRGEMTETAGSWLTAEESITADVLNDFVTREFWGTYTEASRSVRDLNKTGPATRSSLSERDREALQFALRENRFPVEGNLETKLYTIHASKGNQAETVAVWDGIPGKVREGIERSEEERKNEYRTWYVALTRSTDKLFVVRNAFDFMRDSILPRGRKMLELAQQGYDAGEDAGVSP